jgi:hypothetical protein
MQIDQHILIRYFLKQASEEEKEAIRQWIEGALSGSGFASMLPFWRTKQRSSLPQKLLQVNVSGCIPH